MALTHFPTFVALLFFLLIRSLTTISAATTPAPIPSPPSPSPSLSPTAPSPPPISTAAQAYTDAHNKPRSELNIPPLHWNTTLAQTAANLARYQRIKSRCGFADLTTAQGSRRRYGANQFMASGREVTPTEAVENWVKEKAFYDANTNTCTAGHETCGVYTQVVWRKSVALGCAQAVCAKEDKNLTICMYYPPGNVVGEKPY